MIPAIIYLLLRKYRISHPDKAQKIFSGVKKFSQVILLIVLFLAVPQIAGSQNHTLEYVIKRKGNNVGSLYFTQQIAGSKLLLKLESEVKTRMIFLFTARAKEESIYENGIMTWSSIYRKLNGNEKVNKKTSLSGKNYIISHGSRSESLNNYPIQYNMICLYTKEPVGIKTVYSDNFERFINIEIMAAHHYKIRFPDGNYNEYFYVNGICTKIKVNHSLYSAIIELKS